MQVKLNLSQLEQYLSKAAWILKGPIGASDFKAYIFPMLFFKRISDVYDEEYQSALEESDGDEEYAALPEFHRFTIPEGCHWNDVRETTSNIGLKIETCLREIEAANQEHLYGIFGDAQWSNKEKLPDRLLTDLVEHFSQYTLSTKLVARDMLGQAYEYLIKHFADLTNKKAGEFYTPRSVVHLMGLIIDPHEGESIYDPASGTGGMLIESIEHLKEAGEDFRTLKLCGQEKNLTSSSIARMNMFLHGVEDFQIARGDTLRSPAFFDADGLQTFDCVIANPPFSLKEWGADLWVNDPHGRNIAGVPPKGNGDMAWVQHMIQSMKPRTGRMAVVLPHGALFWKAAEGKIRKALLEKDLLEAVIGLGPNIFYGTQLTACVMVFRSEKPADRRQKVIFIDASDQIRTGRAQNFLEPEHVGRIHDWYAKGENVENHVKVATMDDIKENDHNLASSAWLVWIGLAIWGLFIFSEHEVKSLPFEQAFIAADDLVQRELTAFVQRNNVTETLKVYNDLDAVISAYRRHDDVLAQELSVIKSNRESRQRQKYLDSFSIRRANISGIGPAKTASLISFGVETAADVSYAAVLRVPGFGEVMTRKLVAWRRGLESRFKYN